MKNFKFIKIGPHSTLVITIAFSKRRGPSFWYDTVLHHKDFGETATIHKSVIRLGKIK